MAVHYETLLTNTKLQIGYIVTPAYTNELYNYVNYVINRNMNHSFVLQYVITAISTINKRDKVTWVKQLYVQWVKSI